MGSKTLGPPSEGNGGAITSRQLMEQHGSNAFMPQQFNNPANPAVHRKTTAEEIWSGMDGKVDCFIAGVGSTLEGTINGLRSN